MIRLTGGPGYQLPEEQDKRITPGATVPALRNYPEWCLLAAGAYSKQAVSWSWSF